MSSGRRRRRSQPACPRPLANPAQSPYLALWRVRTPLAPGDPASATKSYQKPRACSALATPSIRTDELFRLVSVSFSPRSDGLTIQADRGPHYAGGLSCFGHGPFGMAQLMSL